MAVADLPAFTRLLGVNVLHRSPDRSEAELPVRARSCATAAACSTAARSWHWATRSVG